MARPDFNHLQAFVLVARERSFTRAAAQLGVSQSALSHTIRGLEARLGVRLLTRSTRGVSPTEAGEKLYTELAPHYEAIEAGLSALGETRDQPVGTIRITTHD
ncbi:MAG: LysR family transcriptional regulator, partial [Telluria sp.]